MPNGEMPAKHNCVRHQQLNFKNGTDRSLGDLIQNRREELGISLRELAKRLEISASMLSLIEREKAHPSPAMLGKIGKMFNFSSSDLRKFDTRLRLDHLKRLVEKNPDLGEALRLMLVRIREGKATPERFTKAIIAAGARR